MSKSCKQNILATYPLWYFFSFFHSCRKKLVKKSNLKKKVKKIKNHKRWSPQIKKNSTLSKMYFLHTFFYNVKYKKSILMSLFTNTLYYIKVVLLRKCFYVSHLEKKESFLKPRVDCLRGKDDLSKSTSWSWTNVKTVWERERVGLSVYKKKREKYHEE